jgi:hypothetical protein
MRVPVVATDALEAAAIKLDLDATIALTQDAGDACHRSAVIVIAHFDGLCATKGFGGQGKVGRIVTDAGLRREKHA